MERGTKIKIRRTVADLKMKYHTAIPIIIEGQFQVFQLFSSSKLVLKTVESCFVALNYYGNGSIIPLHNIYNNCTSNDLLIKRFAFKLAGGIQRENRIPVRTRSEQSNVIPHDCQTAYLVFQKGICLRGSSAPANYRVVAFLASDA
jgi:hypothetical protein